MKTLAAALLLTLAAAFAANAAAVQPIGVVLMHGKTGTPAQMTKLAAALSAAGYAVQTPEMCWSATRIFDKPLPDCLAEVDVAVAKLQAAGATRFVIGGISQGGVAAIDYAAGHKGLAGVLAMAPAADPPDTAAYPMFAQAIKTATALVAAGKGDVPTMLDDLVTGGKDVAVKTTPTIYLSFHGPDSPVATVHALTLKDIPRLSAPLLWVAGSDDPSQTGTDKSYAAAPKNPLNQYVTVKADHAGTADAAGDVVLAWLGKLAAK